LDKNAEGKKKNKDSGVGKALKKGFKRNLVGAVVTTVAKPFLIILDYLKKYGYYVGAIMGYVIPFIPEFFFILAVLKYISEVVTTTILVAMSAGKIYNPDGSNIVSPQMTSIITTIMLVSATPLMIVTLQSIAYQIHAPVIGVIQSMIYEGFYELNKPYLLGLGYIGASLGFMLSLSSLALLYLFAMPLQIQQSAHNFLNTGMNVGDPSDAMRSVTSIALVGASMKSLSSGSASPAPAPERAGPTNDSNTNIPANNGKSNEVSNTQNALPSSGQGNHRV